MIVLLERDAEGGAHVGDRTGEPHASPRLAGRDDSQVMRMGKRHHLGDVLGGSSVIGGQLFSCHVVPVANGHRGRGLELGGVGDRRGAEVEPSLQSARRGWTGPITLEPSTALRWLPASETCFEFVDIVSFLGAHGAPVDSRTSAIVRSVDVKYKQGRRITRSLLVEGPSE